MPIPLWGKKDLLLQLTRELSFIESTKDVLHQLEALDPVEALFQFGKIYAHFLTKNKDYLLFMWSPEMRANQEVNMEVSKLLLTMNSHVSVLLKKAVYKNVVQDKLETASAMFLSTIMTVNLLIVY